MLENNKHNILKEIKKKNRDLFKKKKHRNRKHWYRKKEVITSVKKQQQANRSKIAFSQSQFNVSKYEKRADTFVTVRTKAMSNYDSKWYLKWLTLELGRHWKLQQSRKSNIYIYIYIERERERDLKDSKFDSFLNYCQLSCICYAKSSVDIYSYISYFSKA